MDLPSDLSQSTRPVANQNPAPVSPIIGQNQSQPVQPVRTTPPLKTQPTPAISSFSKENEIRVADEKILQEVRADIEVEISKEVKDAGVTEINETVQLPQRITKETGMTETGETASVSKTPTLKLPLDDQKIKYGLKQSISDSILWLANWCVRQIAVAKEKALKLTGIK